MTGAGACAECGAALEPRQEYCLECGRRVRPAVRRPHWLWPASAAALVAAGAAAAAIAASGGGGSPSTIVALPSLRPVTPAPATSGERQARILAWPQRDGHTVVLGAMPEATGAGAARALARRAIAAGLPQVGVLRSARYASLHPGYAVVFAGVYATREDALLALPRAARRFRNAYAQEIVR